MWIQSRRERQSTPQLILFRCWKNKENFSKDFYLYKCIILRTELGFLTIEFIWAIQLNFPCIYYIQTFFIISFLSLHFGCNSCNLCNSCKTWTKYNVNAFNFDNLDSYFNLNKSIKMFHTVTATYHAAVTRIRTWVTSATTKGTNHYTITACRNYEFFCDYLCYTCLLL